MFLICRRIFDEIVSQGEGLLQMYLLSCIVGIADTAFLCVDVVGLDLAANLS